MTDYRAEILSDKDEIGLEGRCSIRLSYQREYLQQPETTVKNKDSPTRKNHNTEQRPLSFPFRQQEAKQEDGANRDSAAPHKWVALRKKPLDVRFWALVDKSGGPGACWPFMGNRTSEGYGQMQVGPRHNGRKALGAHRVSLELKLGRPLLPGECACHRCDNPPCVNPAHLFAGTKSDNHRDMVAKGRRVDVALKLTPERVVRIRVRAAAGESFLAIAADFGVSDRLVGMIAYGEKWATAGGPLTERRKPRAESILREARAALSSTMRAEP